MKKKTKIILTSVAATSVASGLLAGLYATYRIAFHSPKGNQNARKHTETEVDEARKALKSGDFHASKMLVEAAIQRGTENYYEK